MSKEHKGNEWLSLPDNEPNDASVRDFVQDLWKPDCTLRAQCEGATDNTGLIAQFNGNLPSENFGISQIDKGDTNGDKEKLAQVIADLGAPEQRVRDAASLVLSKVGPAALPSLHEALKSNSLETARRAQYIVNSVYLKYHDMPFTDALRNWANNRDMGRLTPLIRLSDVDEQTAKERLEEIIGLKAIMCDADVREFTDADKKERLARLKKHEEDLKSLRKLKDEITAIKQTVTKLGTGPNDDDKILEACVAACPNLRNLSIRGSRITDSALVHLNKLNNLEELWLNDSKITDNGLKGIMDMMRLKRLEMKQTAVTDAGMEYIKNLKGLEYLGLSWTAITDTGMENVKNLTNLKALNLEKTGISDRTLSVLKDMKELEALIIDGTKVTDEGMQHLSGLISLEILDVSNTAVTNEGVARLAKLTNLRSIILNGTNITDDAVKELVKLKKLELLRLTGTLITRKGVDDLKRALPSCLIFRTTSEFE